MRIVLVCKSFRKIVFKAPFFSMHMICIYKSLILMVLAVCAVESMGVAAWAIPSRIAGLVVWMVRLSAGAERNSILHVGVGNGGFWRLWLPPFMAVFAGGG